MADETSKVGVQVDVQVDGAKTIGSLKKDLKDAQGAALALSRQFGELSPQALAAAKKVSDLKDEIKDLNERVALFDPGAKFQAFGNVVNSVGAGLSAAQGAMALFGGESEDLQKQLVKLQGAMALSQGLSTLADSWKDFERLGAIVKTNVVGAFTSLKGALTATGIGALVVLLGTLIANFDDIEKWLKKIIPGFEGFGKVFDKVKAYAMGFFSVLVEQLKMVGEIIGDVLTGHFSAAADVAGDWGKRSAQAYTQGFNDEIAAQADAAAKKALEAQVKAEERNLKILQASGDARAKQSNELERKILQDKIALQEEGSEEYKDAQADLAAFDAKTAADRAQKAKEQAKQAADKRKEDGRKALDELTKQQDLELRMQTISGKDTFDLKARQLQEQKELYVKYGLDLAELQNKQNAEELDRREKLNTALKDKVTAGSSIITAGLQNIAGAQAAMAQQSTDIQAQTAVATEEAEKKKQDSMLATNDLLQALVQDKENLSDIEKAAVVATMITTAIAEQGKRDALDLTQVALKAATQVFGEQTAAGKAFAIASATIETYKAAQMSFSAFAGIPIVGPALGAVAAAAAIVAGIARVRQIMKVKVPGGDASTAAPSDTGAPAMPTVQTDTGTMVQQLDQVNTNLNQPQRVVVLESDITNTQEKVQKVEAQASF